MSDLTRRGFVGSLFGSMAASPLLGFADLFRKKQYLSEYGLGEYKKHSFQLNYTWERLPFERGDLYEYPLFPFELILDIEYEKGTETYSCFNPSKIEVARLANMGPKELFKHRVKGEKKDNLAIEFFFTTFDASFITKDKTKNMKFRISHVTFHGNNKEESPLIIGGSVLKG
jgi:hypothetical protein